MYQVYCSRMIMYKDSPFKESHIIQRLQITWCMGIENIDPSFVICSNTK